MEEIECWKLLKVVVDSGRMLSSNVTGPAQVEYHINMWNKAKSAMSDKEFDICVFTDRNCAVRYSEAYIRMYDRYDYQLWKCIGRGSHPAFVFVNPGSLRSKEIRRFGVGGVPGVLKAIAAYGFASKGNFPKNTVMVKELMLVERVNL